jgi:hypothetical protein
VEIREPEVLEISWKGLFTVRLVKHHPPGVNPEIFEQKPLKEMFLRYTCKFFVILCKS